MSSKPPNAHSCALFLPYADEVISIVNSLKNSDSSGYYEIATNLIKKVVAHIAEPLSLIINPCLSVGIFPDKLKTAKVCPVFKSGDIMEFNNYRPISLLPSFSKIFEKIIANRLLSFIEKHNILSSTQFGFRKNHSTSLALLEVIDACYKNLDANNKVLDIYFDLSKAFDTVA